MPPFDLTAGTRTLLGYWGQIQAAVAERWDTHALYSAVYNAQVDAGNAPGGFSITDMGALRSLAVGQRNADAAFNSAQQSSPIDATMIGLAPWSNPLEVRNLAPSWEVRFEQTLLQDGVETTIWRTTVIDGQLPGSVGDLNAQLDGEAQDLANSYGETHMAIGNVSITAV